MCNGLWIFQKKTAYKYFYTFHFWIFLIKRNKVSNVSMKKYAEIGLPWRVSLSKVKYLVVVPFITHESWCFIKISIHLTKPLVNLNFLKTELKRVKSFSNIHSYRNTSILNQFPISIMPWINLPLSLINLFLHSLLWGN